MKYLKQHLLAIGITIVLIIGCKNSNQNKAQESTEIELNDKHSTIDTSDSLTLEVSHSASVKTEDDSNELPKGRLDGFHNLTIQWISWDDPGEIIFTSIGPKQYKVEGFQKGNEFDECPDCYLKVSGTIEEITPKTLKFTGKIESTIFHINEGLPCIKEGTFEFISTKNRKYWRCQNMNGCDGVTNYVDIYF